MRNSNNIRVLVSIASNVTQLLVGVVLIKILATKAGIDALSTWYIVGTLVGLSDFVDFAYSRVIPRKFLNHSLSEMRNLVRNFTISSIILIFISLVLADFLNLEINILALILFSFSIFLLKYVEALSLPFTKLFESKILSVLIGILKISGLFFFIENLNDILILFLLLNLTNALILVILYWKTVELEVAVPEIMTSLRLKLWITLVANFFLYKSLLFFIDGKDAVSIIRVGLSIQLVLMLSAIGYNVYSGVEDKILMTIKNNDNRLLINQVKDTILKLVLLVLLIIFPLIFFPNHIERITGMPLYVFSIGELLFLGFIILLVSISSVSSSVLLHFGVFTSHYTSIFQVILMLLLAKLAVVNDWLFLLMYIPWISQLYNHAYRPYQLYKRLTQNC